MYRFVYLTLCLTVFGSSDARMPKDLKQMLGLGEETQTKSPLTSLKEELRNEPGTFLGTDFDLGKFLSQQPPNMASSIETARRKLGSGDVEMYMPGKVTVVECHVEFQVTERVPGRCTRLAGSIPACQAEKYIGINYNECS